MATAEEYIKKAQVNMDMDQWDEAIINLKFAEKLDPDNPAIHMFFFSAYGMVRDNVSAKKHFLRLNQLRPEYAEKVLQGMPDFIRSSMGL
jgi:two-component SAPR family response regulator